MSFVCDVRVGLKLDREEENKKIREIFIRIETKTKNVIHCFVISYQFHIWNYSAQLMRAATSNHNLSRRKKKIESVT